MNYLSFTTRVLLIIGGLNWLLVGLFEFDVVAAIFSGSLYPVARVIYVLVGASALWQIYVLCTTRSGSQ